LCIVILMKKILVRFVEWTKVKFKIHTSDEIEFFFKEREIWWCSLGINIGHEQEGKNDRFERPVLVLKKFNKHLLWVLPLTRKGKASQYYSRLEQGGEDSFVILSQIRTISSKRLARKMRTMKETEFSQIKVKIKDFLT
jgi:mRNA-degrading endonuclease toxin of MazEF toxin-antitoxin module